MDDTTPVRQFRFRAPPGACDILIARHGESAPAVAGEEFPLVDGHADPPLHEQGHAEAARLAERLTHEEISAIYVTSLTRTQQTAAPLAAHLGITPIIEPELREVHLGEWEGGEYRRRAVAGDPRIAEVMTTGDWAVIPGAETMAALQARVGAAIERIADAHPDQRVLVVVHGGVIGALMALATGGRPMAFVISDNASLSHMVVTAATADQPRRWILRRFNDTGHLDTDLDKPVQPLT